VSSVSSALCRPASPEAAAPVQPFDGNLVRYALSLVRGKTHTLQVNTGLLCDLFCRHCHLEAGPQRREVMTRETMDDVVAYASRVPFETIDITGGAPELVPGIGAFLARLAPLTRKLILRTNLVAFRQGAASGLMESCRDLGVALVASFPSTHAAQADALRGLGFWGKGIEVLRELNRLGYGSPESGLTLDLVVNPAGAFLPGNQTPEEKRFKQRLERQGIAFNHLYSFANVPLGRFRTWLEQSGNLGPYFELLFERFNPATVEGLMCRSLISVSWDGTLYDCDFNIAAGLPHGSERIHQTFAGLENRIPEAPKMSGARRDHDFRRSLHVSSLTGCPEEGAVIATGDHCYACTAGAGFT